MGCRRGDEGADDTRQPLRSDSDSDSNASQREREREREREEGRERMDGEDCSSGGGTQARHSSDELVGWLLVSA